MPQIYFLSWRQNKRNSCQSTCLLVPQKSFKGVIKYETNPNNALLREIPENGHTFAASLILPKWVKTSFLVTFPSCPRLLGLRAFWTVCNASSFMDDKQRQHNIAFRKQHLLRKQTSHFSESTRRVVFFCATPPISRNNDCALQAQSQAWKPEDFLKSQGSHKLSVQPSVPQWPSKNSPTNLESWISGGKKMTLRFCGGFEASNLSGQSQ